MKPFLLIMTAITLATTQAFAQRQSLFVQALKEGMASAPLLSDPRMEKTVAELQKSTNSSGEITVTAARLLKFTQQPRCGRIQYWIEQSSTKTRWTQLGGQINMCEDGLPPWLVCADQTLVPPGLPCRDKSTPVMTDEVKATIQAAVAAGGLTTNQIEQKLKAQKASK